MRKLIFIAAVLLCLSSIAASQDPGYDCIYGNKDGTTIDSYIDSYIEVKLWAATPGMNDPVAFIHNPLASNDAHIATRDGGDVFYPLNTWPWEFLPPNPNSPPGHTNQSLLGYYDLGGPPPNYMPLNTEGDTIHIANFFMRTSGDSSLMGQTVCPFVEGLNPVNGTTLWGLWGGVDAVVPSLTFSCLYFVDYLAGDANGSGSINGLDVVYLVDYLKGINPPPDPIYAGDANGDCIVNGVDVVYLVAYLKGGAAPFLGNCH